MDWNTFAESTRTHTPEAQIALRLCLAVLFGGIFGLERELRDRPAGLRTHMLTALAAALFTIITFEIFHTVRAIENNANVDPIRIIEAVTAGVAFLAAGAIIQNRGRVEGLTTGAGMWLAGALGVACGVGYYTLAMMAAVLAFIIMAVLGRLERQFLEKAKSEGKS
jgi:putative Mg2+ transporter-C (MgtC) family protein